VVHRDIKPGNVLLCSLNEEAPGQLTTANVKLTDFGISVPFTPGRVSALSWQDYAAEGTATCWKNNSAT
jgi:serine/threonine protein kinase